MVEPDETDAGEAKARVAPRVRLVRRVEWCGEGDPDEDDEAEFADDEEESESE